MTNPVNGCSCARADGDFSDEAVGRWNGGKRERNVAVMDAFAPPVSEGVSDFYKNRVGARSLKVAPFLGNSQRKCALGITVCLARAHVYI